MNRIWRIIVLLVAQLKAWTRTVMWPHLVALYRGRPEHGPILRAIGDGLRAVGRALGWLWKQRPSLRNNVTAMFLRVLVSLVFVWFFWNPYAPNRTLVGLVTNGMGERIRELWRDYLALGTDLAGIGLQALMALGALLVLLALGSFIGKAERPLRRFFWTILVIVPVCMAVFLVIEQGEWGIVKLAIAGAAIGLFIWFTYTAHVGIGNIGMYVVGLIIGALIFLPFYSGLIDASYVSVMSAVVVWYGLVIGMAIAGIRAQQLWVWIRTVVGVPSEAPAHGHATPSGHGQNDDDGQAADGADAPPAR